MLVENVDTGIVQELRYDVAMRLVERGLYKHITAKEQTEEKPKVAPKRSPKPKKQS